MTSAPPRLKRRREFVRASNRGRKAAVPGLVLQTVEREGGMPEPEVAPAPVKKNRDEWEMPTESLNG